MKVVVVYKWARDPEAAVVRPDGAVDWGNAKMVPGDDDPAALALAKSLVGQAGGEVVGLTIGNGDPSWILARGVDTTFNVPEAGVLADDAATAAVLAAAIAAIGEVDLVAIGDPAASGGVAPALAGHLGWPLLLGIVEAQLQGGEVHAIRTESGTRDTFRLPMPVVMGIAALGEEAKRPGMMEMIKARKKPVQTLTLEQLGVTAQEGIAPGTARLPGAAGAVMFEGTPAETVGQLLAAVRSEGVL